jgi:hypothetical protein
VFFTQINTCMRRRVHPPMLMSHLIECDSTKLVTRGYSPKGIGRNVMKHHDWIHIQAGEWVFLFRAASRLALRPTKRHSDGLQA